MIFYCVLDFEATCIKDKVLYNQEIIQFPSILYKYYETDETDKTLEYLDEFNEYVKPEINPILSDFCKELTGIQQETVDNADTFKNVLKRHYLWLLSHNALENLIFITVGNWDLDIMFPNQLKLVGMKNKKEYLHWINIKDAFRDCYKHKPSGLLDMLKFLNMEFIGHQHNGLDDTRNTARIFERMIKDQYIFK